MRRIIEEESAKILKESAGKADARMWASAGGMHTLSVQIESDFKHGLLPPGFEEELDKLLSGFFATNGFDYNWRRGR